MHQRYDTDACEITAHAMAHPHRLDRAFVNGMDVLAAQAAGQQVRPREARAPGWRELGMSLAKIVASLTGQPGRS